MHSFTRFLLAFLPVAALVSLLCTFAGAEVTVTTDPVGVTTTPLLGSSDTYLSIPFTRSPEFVGSISFAATTGTTGVITVAGNPWTANQFVYAGTQHNHYYALIGPISGTGTKEGHTYLVTGNGTGTLMVDASHDDSSNLNTIPATTQVQVIPYWTPATIFPASDANISFTPTTSPPTYKTLLQVPDYSAPAYNAPYTAQYYFDGNSSSWHRINGKGGDGGVGDDDPLLPDGYFVVHNGNKAPTRVLTNLGAVLLRKMSTPLATATNRTQDNPIGMVRPFDVALNATGLGPANGSFVAGDQLLVFNNAQAAFKKSPASYFYDTSVGNSGGWRLVGDTTATTDRGADIIPRGTGVVVRKAQTSSGESVLWTNAFPVQAIGAASIKIHGTGTGAQTLGVTLPLNTQFNTPPGIECRFPGLTPAGIGIDDQIVITFPTPVSFSNVVSTSGGASVDSFSGNESATVTINLKNVVNTRKTTVTLVGVNDGQNTNDVAVQMGVLFGDVNATGAVDKNDVAAVQKHLGQTVNQANFRFDVNATGAIDGADVSMTQGQARTSLR
jgi:uncharacterized protein (TIGR02597 family)